MSRAILDFIPRYCPQCRREFQIHSDKYARNDFYAGCAHTCQCGFQFQFVQPSQIKKTVEHTKKGESHA